MLRPTAILETVLYVDRLDRAETFYREVIGLDLLHTDPRMRALDVNGRGVLLLFQRGATTQDVNTPFGTIPSHDGQGPAHMAFAVGAEDLGLWRDRLADAGIPVESEVAWPRGGRSLYFRDPDDHCIELATPGLWQGY
ncbi:MULTISPECIES: VOC family protein [unclassified Meridianimarinicoccus]|uniref:VOC family protein n=1 Tax=unclassified Meridianimarinicoccus TaxID=2923344 RepID=UPI001866C34C|nr:VOC family protein [Fluviibacterium sp. MJW13]